MTVNEEINAFPELTHRQQEVLSFIIRTYTETPEPVSSKTLVERHELDISSATVRNEMARLEEMGYITAPHTSAGRVPTTRGYRYFVRKLMENPEGLSSLERRQIDTRFGALPTMLEQWLRQAASVLARTAHTASLITQPGSGSNRFKHVELISIQGRLVLMVLVLQGGVVHQRMLNLAEPVQQHALSEAADRLNTLCENLNANELRVKRHALGVLEQEVLEIAFEVMERGDTHSGRVVYRDGLTEAVGTFSDGTGAQQVIRFFEERAFLDLLLTEILQPANSDDENVQVIVAGDGRWEEISRLSMVLSHYGVPGQMSGTLGVIGPTTINYGRAISTVRHIAGLMTQRLTRLYNDDEDDGSVAQLNPPES
jgi:heat-inducible transcriptional repressor